jgi:hypothetical protein
MYAELFVEAAARLIRDVLTNPLVVQSASATSTFVTQFGLIVIMALALALVMVRRNDALR